MAIASTFLGDRVKVRDISIENDEIVLHMITHGPAEPICWPTLEVTQKYRLEGGILVQPPVDDWLYDLGGDRR
ncbi:MAG: hypothetical protein JSV16_14005 [Candidatus Hydrogenedentota bacterium]|nr:MAG: hypothetical protein JSV16_14005 [Candidatus Hydrogenedentota bacterium]